MGPVNVFSFIQLSNFREECSGMMKDFFKELREKKQREKEADQALERGS